MESDQDESADRQSPEAELAEIRRAVQRPHLDYPDTPAWTYVTTGACAALYTWSWSLGQPYPGLLVMTAAIAGIFVIIGHITRMRGVFPEFSTMPASLKREAYLAWGLILVLAPIVWVTWRWVGVMPAVVLSGVAFAIIMYIHQRRHDAVVASIKASSPPS